MTLVVYGDVTGDATVDNRDALKVLGGDLSDIEKKAADINDTGDVADNRDGLAILQFHTDVRSPLVDPSKLASDNISSSIGAKVKVEPSYSGNNGLWAVEPNASSTDVTLKVEGANTASSSATVQFTLTNVPSDAKLADTNNEKIKLGNISNKGGATVTVPKKVGSYSFTLTSVSKGSQSITVNVVDVTLPDYTKVTFEEIQEEDVSKVANVPEVIENMKDVYKSENKSTYNQNTHTYKGNVNNMQESVNENNVTGKYYWARIKVNGYSNINNLVATYVQNGKVVRLQPVPVEGTENSVFVLLDANMKETKLVMAPKEAVDAQILKASSENKFNTVNFDSTSILQRYKARQSDDHETNNAIGKQNSHIVSVEEDSVVSNKITVGVNFDTLKEVLLDTKDYSIKTESSPTTRAGKWVPIVVQLLKTNGNINLGSLLTLTGDDVILQTVESNKIEVYLWVNADAEETKTCKITYSATNGTTENLTLQIDIHDAAKPVIEAAYEGADENSKGIVVTKEPVVDSDYEVKIATYKYAMDVLENPNGTQDDEGRWYSIAIETQLPVNSLVYEKTGKWAELEPEMVTEDGKIIRWLNADETYSSKSVIKLANKWTVKVGDNSSNYNDETIDVKVTQNENTRVQLGIPEADENQIGGSFINNSYNYNDTQKLNGITIVEPKLPEKINSNNKLTLNNNLSIAQKLNYGNEGFKKTDKDGSVYTTIKLPVSNVSKIKVNNVEGKWMVFYLIIDENADIIDKNGGAESGIIVDSKNAEKLLTTKLENKKRFVPVWINLDNTNVQKSISKETSTTETVDIKFGYTTVVENKTIEEENVCKVNFIDSSNDTIGDLEGKVSAPSEPNAPDWKDIKDKQNEKQKLFKDWINPQATGNENYGEQLVNNMEVMNDASIDIIDVFDNTIYVRVTAELDRLAILNNENSKVVPMTFDISMLKDVPGTKYYFSGDGTTWKKSWENDHTDEIWNFGLYLGNGDVNGVVKELYFTKSDNDTLSNFDLPYVHYIVEFVQK